MAVSTCLRKTPTQEKQLKWDIAKLPIHPSSPRFFLRKLFSLTAFQANKIFPKCLELGHHRPPLHIVPFGKFHGIGGAPPETFLKVKYDASEDVGGDRKCFDRPIRK